MVTLHDSDAHNPTLEAVTAKKYQPAVTCPMAWSGLRGVKPSQDVENRPLVWNCAICARLTPEQQQAGSVLQMRCSPGVENHLMARKEVGGDGAAPLVVCRHPSDHYSLRVVCQFIDRGYGVKGDDRIGVAYQLQEYVGAWRRSLAEAPGGCRPQF